MKRRTLTPALGAVALLTALLVPAASIAETMAYAIDPVHSQVEFKIRHLVARTSGQFDDFSGTAWLDPNDVEGTFKLEGTVATASIDTDNQKRDDHLKSPDFFDVETHPEMTFVSKKVKKNGDGYVVTGDLTMLGVTKSVSLDAEILGFMTNPFTGTSSTGIELTGKINRKDFGMSWNKALDAGGVVLGDDVSIAIQLEATVPPEKS